MKAILLAIALILVPMASQAYASDVEIIDVPKTWVFVQDCKANIEGLAIPNSQVVCFPRASIVKIEQNVELLRQVFPSDIFIFTYDLRDKATARDFTLFLRAHDSNAPAGALGRAFVHGGYAISVNSNLVVGHEWEHVSTCSVAHNQFGEPDTSKPIAVKPWC